MKKNILNQNIIKLLFVFLLWISIPVSGQLLPGIDVFMKDGTSLQLKGKNVALVSNQTGLSADLTPTLEVLKKAAKKWNFTIVAILSPEHGFSGSAYAGEKVQEKHDIGIPIYDLYGATRRPTDKMLHGVDIIFFDIQDIGCRSYTFTTTLFYIMEAAGKRGITVVVLDRPNPMGGVVVDGPMLENELSSFIGYVDVPYCYGMTIGELALFFNTQNKTPCKLEIIPMSGWNRTMSFIDTGLVWQLTSPQIPEEDTPFFYTTTGLIGELGVVNIGVGYTLPFKILGAPWIDANTFAHALNDHKFKGVTFLPFYFKPYFGIHAKEDCQGVRIIITDKKKFHPVQTCYLILATLKALYPKEFISKIQNLPEERKNMFYKACGTKNILQILKEEPTPLWKLINLDKKKRDAFIKTRKKFLLYN